jgi:hypothetical protein
VYQEGQREFLEVSEGERVDRRGMIFDIVTIGKEDLLGIF